MNRRKVEAATSVRPLRQLGRFAGIGLLNTGIHLAVVWQLVEQTRIPAPIGNGCAFLVANLFSFFVNGAFTFGVPPSLRRYARFLVVSMAGLLLTVAASWAAQALHWHYLLGVALSMVLLPGLSFVVHRHWTWHGA
ncbi:MAG: GtrA family protein [Comamonadaceae bacterium]|nr:MAG: GtrA family protein [Comamonadaceae bacterium]